MSQRQDLDHHVWKKIKQHGLQKKKILVALSGGVDSVALLRTTMKVHEIGLLGAAYFHHGEDSNQKYRAEAQDFCRNLCLNWGVSFSVLVQSASLNDVEAGITIEPQNNEIKIEVLSEAENRQQRYKALTQLMKEHGFEVLATGHHRDDLLETRLLRLIRGTGAQGFQAMSDYKAGVFRPFLEVGKQDLRDYLTQAEVDRIEDPSNLSLDPFRNWIREEWLQNLEKRQKGSVHTLARSLETIATELAVQPWGDLWEQNQIYKKQISSDLDPGILRSFYLTLTASEQKRLLAQYLYVLGVRNFSQSHLEEVQKRLDKSQKVITFVMCGCNWVVNAEQIKVQS
jgi:tRNA(Ile)-lysidine synthase